MSVRPHAFASVMVPQAVTYDGPLGKGRRIDYVRAYVKCTVCGAVQAFMPVPWWAQPIGAVDPCPQANTGERAQKLQEIRADRMERAGEPQLRADLVRRDVVASQRLAGVDARSAPTFRCDRCDAVRSFLWEPDDTGPCPACLIGTLRYVGLETE
jgi:hypothetical protein